MIDLEAVARIVGFGVWMFALAVMSVFAVIGVQHVMTQQPEPTLPPVDAVACELGGEYLWAQDTTRTLRTYHCARDA